MAKVLIKRTSTPNSPPVAGSLLPGELAIEMGIPTRLWVGVPNTLDPSGRKLLNGGVIISDTAPLMNPGALWWESDAGILWLCYQDADSIQWVQAAGSSGGSSGVIISDTPPAATAVGQLWWESDSAILWIWYDDGDTQQWVQAAGSSGGATGDFVEIAGDTMSGNLTIYNAAAAAVYNASSAAEDAAITLSKGASGKSVQLNGYTADKHRWQIRLGNSTPEGGANSGSDFTLSRSADDGTTLGDVITIDRASGTTQFIGSVYSNLTIGANNFYAGAPAPLITIDRTNPALGSAIMGQFNQSGRWQMDLGVGAEGGANSGSNFVLQRYADDGITSLGYALTINRVDGAAAFYGAGMLVDNPAGDSWLTIHGTTAAAISGQAGNSGGGIVLHLAYTPERNFEVHRLLDDGTTFGCLTINRLSGLISLHGPTQNNSSYTGVGISSNTYVLAGGLSDFGMNTDGAGGRYFNLNANSGGAFLTTGASGDISLFMYGMPRWTVPSNSGNFHVMQNGAKPGGGDWADSSDARIKDVLGDYTSGLAAVMALRPVRYTFKGNDTLSEPTATPRIGDDGAPVLNNSLPVTVPYPNSPHVWAAKEAKTFIGLVAQEAETAMPELVTQEAGFIDGNAVTDLRQLDTTPLIFALINAVKELKAEIDILKAGA